MSSANTTTSSSTALSASNSAATALGWFPAPAKTQTYKEQTSELLQAYTNSYQQWVTSSDDDLSTRIVALAKTWQKTTPASVNQLQYKGMLDAYIEWHDILHVDIPGLIKRHEDLLKSRVAVPVDQSTMDFLARLDSKAVESLQAAATEAFDKDLLSVQQQKANLENLVKKVTTALRELKAALNPFVAIYGGYSNMSVVTHPLDSLWRVESAVQNRRVEKAAENTNS